METLLLAETSLLLKFETSRLESYTLSYFRGNNVKCYYLGTLHGQYAKVRRYVRQVVSVSGTHKGGRALRSLQDIERKVELWD